MTSEWLSVVTGLALGCVVDARFFLQIRSEYRRTISGREYRLAERMGYIDWFVFVVVGSWITEFDRRSAFASGKNVFFLAVESATTHYVNCFRPLPRTESYRV